MAFNFILLHFPEDIKESILLIICFVGAACAFEGTSLQGIAAGVGPGYSRHRSLGMAMFIGTSNQLGEFESGVTAALFGTVPAVLTGGIGTILVVFLWVRIFPQLAHVDTLDQ
jgi:hypothetical protein